MNDRLTAGQRANISIDGGVLLIEQSQGLGRVNVLPVCDIACDGGYD